MAIMKTLFAGRPSPVTQGQPLMGQSHAWGVSTWAGWVGSQGPWVGWGREAEPQAGWGGEPGAS